MDPITAVAQMLTAFFNMITAIVEGQPPEVKAKEWARWEKFLDSAEQLLALLMPKQQPK